MTTNIQAPAPLSRSIPSDPNITEHDAAVQLLYEAILELQAKVVELEERLEAVEP